MIIARIKETHLIIVLFYINQKQYAILNLTIDLTSNRKYMGKESYLAIMFMTIFVTHILLFWIISMD